MTSSSGTDESTDEDSESSDDEYIRRKTAIKAGNKQHEPKFKPIGPDSGSVVDTKPRLSNEYISSDVSFQFSFNIKFNL